MSDSPLTDGQKPSGAGPHLDLHLRTDLLHGILSPQEEQMALAHLANCPSCEEESRRMVARHERLQTKAGTTQSEALAANLSEFAARLPVAGAEDVPPHSWTQSLDRLRRTLRTLPLGLAGGLAAAAIVVVLLLNTGDGLQLYPLPPATVVRHVADDAASVPSADLAAGLQAYTEGDFERAVGHLREAETSLRYAVLKEVYLGCALAGSGDYAAAVPVLLAIDPAELADDYAEAHWALYVSLTRTGQSARADSLLRILVGTEGEVGDRARRRLSR